MSRRRRLAKSLFIPPYYFSREWIALRLKVCKRDKNRCQYCGEYGMQADHVVPRKKNGADKMSNLVCCCPRCNRIARGRVFKSFEAKKRYILAVIGRLAKTRIKSRSRK